MLKRVILCFVVLVGLFLPTQSRAEDNIPLAETIQKSVELSQDWLVNFQKDDGLYHYIFRPWGVDRSSTVQEESPRSHSVAPGTAITPPPVESYAPYPNQNNIVRQILSYWALIKSTDFRSSHEVLGSIKEFEDGLAPYVVIEDSEYGKALFVDFRDGMKVNSTALYLASLLAKKERGISLSDEQEKHIEYAVNGLKVFAAPTEGFYYYHSADRLNFISSYGSGEAQLALAQYVNFTKDEALYQSIHKRFDEYFNVYYKNNFTLPSSYVDKERVGYHTWALYYLSEIDKYKPVDYQKYVRPLVQFALDFKKVNPECKDNPCIYSMQMWDSSSVEGLTAAYTLMLKYEKDAAFMQQVKDYLDEAVVHLLSLQINSVDEYQQKTGNAFTNNPKHIIGGFCDWPECYYLRNEVTMHVSAALMNYYKIFLTDNN